MTAMTTMKAAARYQQLTRVRQHYLDVARNCAELTLPWIAPPEGWTGDSPLYQAYQGFGARCVTNLASRLMMAMYPPGMSSFRLDIPSELLVQEGELEEDEEISRQLAQTEELIEAEIERRKWRQPTVRSLLALVVTGNALEQIMPDNRVRTHRLDQYVVVRDEFGDEREIILRERLEQDDGSGGLQMAPSSSHGHTEQDLYTWCVRGADGLWTVHQERAGDEVPGSRGTYRLLPFKALRWTAVDGEHYGRGKCEDHLGDLKSVEGLSKSALDGAAMASRNIMMTRPEAGNNLARRITRADNGDVVSGDPEAVSMLQFDNVQGMQVAAQELEKRKNELGMAFLLYSGAQRNAERVTATEVRQLAEEVEGVLGGTYSLLTTDMQGWRLARLIHQMQAQRKLPDWPEGMVEPTVLTGLESLGREQDVNRVSQALQLVSGMPEQALMYINWPGMLNKAMAGLGLPGVVHSQQEVEQMQQQQMVQQAMSSAAQAGGEAAGQRAAQEEPV